MAGPSQQAIAAALLERHGRTYAQELRIDVGRGTPSPLFRLLCAALLFSARISTDIAVRAAEALRREGWTTARAMAGATWAQRTRVLNRSGYARYDERTSRMLGETSELLLERWGGDLRRLREEAGRDPGRERELLKACKGMGDVGVDIFFREAQVAWDELRPFADRRALDAAGKLGLPTDARGLARLVDGGDVARLVTALVRVRRADERRAVLEDAAGK